MQRRFIWLAIAAGLLITGALIYAQQPPIENPPANNRSSIEPESVAPAIVAPVKPSPWTMLVVGDIMLDRNVRASIRQNSKLFPFEKIQSELTGDIVLGNLEGPFTDSTNYAVSGGSLIFTFDPAMAPVLKEIGFTHLSLANNHTRNNGQAGLDNTRRVLADAGLNYFGDPSNIRGFGLEAWVKQDHLAFIGYDGLSAGFENIIADVREAKSNGMSTIVMPHWGAEYQLGIQTRLQNQAHQLIDAGADLVLGGHPHVVEPFEIYQDKFIAYSLGNFLFDQYFSEDTLQGLMLRLTFTTDAINIEPIPIRTTDKQVQLLTDNRHDALLNRLAENSSVPDELRGGIRQGNFTINR